MTFPTPTLTVAEAESLIERLKAEHKEFAEKNSRYARGQGPEDRLELRAESNGHAIMLGFATGLLREAAANTREAGK